MRGSMRRAWSIGWSRFYSMTSSFFLYSLDNVADGNAAGTYLIAPDRQFNCERSGHVATNRGPVLYCKTLPKLTSLFCEGSTYG